MKLSLEEKLKLQEMVPFWYVSDSYAVSPLKVINVTRKYFEGSSGSRTSIQSNYKSNIYKSMRDFEHHKKVLIKEQYNTNYKGLKESLDYYDEFREQNPEYFV